MKEIVVVLAISTKKERGWIKSPLSMIVGVT